MIRWIALLLLPLCWPARLPKEDDTIRWSASRRLVWNDFKGKPDGTRDDAALTSSGIGFGYSYSDRDGFTWHIAGLFDKEKSWVKMKDDYILAHEQGHFDITEIFARRLNKELKEYKVSKDRVQKDAPAIYQAIMKEQFEMENRYDDETDNSRKKDKQAAWLEKIRNELNGLERYADYK
ncbi:MAG TPA: DUF922 domain-containing protein [Chitinophagaceae bacterium]